MQTVKFPPLVSCNDPAGKKPLLLFSFWQADMLMKRKKTFCEAEPVIQARNQLGTPGGAKCFPRGAQFF